MIEQLTENESETNASRNIDVDELCKRLDATIKWDLYRSAIGSWVVACDNGSRKVTFQFDTIRESMQVALVYRWPRVIPKRPWSFSMAGVEVRRVGKVWEVRVDGRFFMNASGTKTKTMEQMEKFSRRSIESAEAWDREYSHVVANGVEGTDWEYER